MPDYLLALLVIFMGVAWAIVRAIGFPRSSEKWVCTEGTVYIGRVGTRYDANGEEFHEPQIRCIYKVNGVIYSIPVENADSWKATQWEWENVSRYYPDGYTLPVYYDPRNPRRAFVNVFRSES